MKKELEQHILKIGHLNDGIEKEVNEILKLLDEEDSNVWKWRIETHRLKLLSYYKDFARRRYNRGGKYMYQG